MRIEFRDLGRQYAAIKNQIDTSISSVISSTAFIHGKEVGELEKVLAKYVGVKHCITCANGTDALELALMAWGIGKGDVVFVPDFTFFSSGEVVSSVGAVPIFVDVEEDTFNISPSSLEKLIERSVANGDRIKAVIAVDLFGQPANYADIREITDKYGLLLLEDGAQGFGGSIKGKMACSFGDVSTTSFFPAKPLGCYGDGGAIFTDNDEWAELIRSLCVHGKGDSKYDNVRIGMNSRLDTIQAAVLLEKIDHFKNYEMEKMQQLASRYTTLLKDIATTPIIREGYISSWAQYTIKVPDKWQRDKIMSGLKDEGIPTAVYYQKPMHKQKAFDAYKYCENDYKISNILSETVLSLPFHPYLEKEELEFIAKEIKELMGKE